MRDRNAVSMTVEKPKDRIDGPFLARIDVNDSTFSYGEEMTPYLNDDGSYTSLFLPSYYDGQWMFRRRLRSDGVGNELIARASVNASGELVTPIHIESRCCDLRKVYPLMGSWEDVRLVIEDLDRVNKRHEVPRFPVCILVPDCMFNQVRRLERHYKYGVMDSGVLYADLYFDDDEETIAIEAPFDDEFIYHFAETDDWEPIVPFLSGRISYDGDIMEPLTLECNYGAKVLKSEYPEFYQSK